ncbi:hypothetical protein Leryth_017109 [Lithospermum erythrorhizon]|nr:hypothetical protein Leryth_017109 [Lithospermum erythrorhizon]
MSPRPSHQLGIPPNLARILYEYDLSTACWDSEKDSCVDHIRSVPPNGATDSLESSVELMKEIAILEVEILHMEHYILSLYRKAFKHHLQPLSRSCVVDSASKVTSTLSTPDNPIYVEMSHDTLKGGIDRNDQESHSNGLPGLYGKNEMLSNSSSRREKLRSHSGHRSLADHLGASRMDDALKSPDKLSEDIVRCISSIYCRLADPRPAEKEFPASSSSSSTSSSGIYTPKNLSGSWSPCQNEEGKKCFKSERQNDEIPYEMVMEVLKLCLDDASYQYASMMLQKFRSLVKILEKVDPKKMKREEKLTFWINIHNALVMHAYLAYGTRNYITNTTILKAAYNVGGYFINAYDIQSSILGIRSHYSAPWMQLFLSPGKKLLAGNTKHAYQIEYPEPLVHFALCSGSYSDPVLRVYRAKNVFEDLKVAQQEFILANVDVTKEKQIPMPKILSYFAKDMSLNIVGLLEIVGAYLPEVQQKASTMDRPEKHTYWLSRISTFRYLIHKDVMQGMYL